MRKLFILLSLLFVSAASFADEYIVGSVTVYEQKFSTERTVRLKYDDDGQYYLQFSSPMYVAWFFLSEDQLKALRVTVDKALEWGKISEAKKVEVFKELPNSKLDGRVAWRLSTNSNNFYTSNTFSIMWIYGGMDTGEWAVVMGSNEAKSRQNQFMTYSTDYLVFEKDKVLELKKIISEDNIKKVKAENSKTKQSAEELFQ